MLTCENIVYVEAPLSTTTIASDYSCMALIHEEPSYAYECLISPWLCFGCSDITKLTISRNGIDANFL